MAATKDNPIVFYDLLSNEGPWSPNTFKTRLTLNYKRIPYRVEYLSFLEIEPKLKELGVPPSTLNPLFKYTVPLIEDPSGDPNGRPTYVADSFNIAIYLDVKYPAPKYPAVFPRGTRALQKLAYDHITNIGMLFAPIMLPLPVLRPGFLDERSLEYYNRTRSEIFGTELPKLLESAPASWDAVQARWDTMGQVLDLNQGGPFTMGQQISFVDFAIGGLFHGLRKTEGGDMANWKRVAKWQDGRWDALWKEIEKLGADSTEVTK